MKNATGGSAVPASQARLRQAREIAGISLQHREDQSKGASRRVVYGLASGAASTCRHAAGSCARVIGGFGFGGIFGGFGCSTESLNQ
jgi:hypothetical protein